MLINGLKKGFVIGGAMALVFGFGLRFGGETVFAESDALTFGECIEDGMDFDAFLQTIISQHGFQEGFVEYWKDILKRNACHSNDIFTLDAQLDRIKSNLQDAFLKCQGEKIPALEKAYYKIDAEIYFVRHIVNSDFDADSLEEGDEIPESAFTNLGTLYGDMLVAYIERFDDDNEFGLFFDRLVMKYGERKFSYIICESKGYGWEKVEEKFKEFFENWGGAKEGAEGFENQVKAGAKGFERAIDRPWTSFGTFLDNTIGMTINGVSPKQGLGEIYDEINSYALGSPTPDLKTLYQRSSGEADRYEKDISYAKLTAKYEAMYRRNTDATIQEFLDSLDELRGYLQESTLYLKGIFDCTKKMANKQCP